MAAAAGFPGNPSGGGALDNARNGNETNFVAPPLWGPGGCDGAALGSPLTCAADTAALAIRAVRDPTSGQIDVVEGDRPVLRY